MSRSPRKYVVELRIRDNDGGAAVGTVDRFLYTDEKGQEWIRVRREWFPVTDQHEELHAFIFELPRDIQMEQAA